jgi:ACR3 family arsenite transporter
LIPVLSVLGTMSRHGRAVLVAGLLVGILLPGFALAMKGLIPEMIALMLFLAALRVGPQQAVGAARDLGFSLGLILALQVALPVLVALACHIAGWSGPLALALTLMAAAAPISGSPNLTILAGGDPAPALRQLIVGTALLPLTVVPVFWLVPHLGNGGSVLTAATRLLLIIGLAATAAFLIRGFILHRPSQTVTQAIDGLSALVMGLVVVGLMSAVGPAIRTQPLALGVNLVAAFAANFGLQIAAALTMRRSGLKRYALPIGIVAGNRNIALFLTALPATVTDPLLLFIGCYQIPMYLTPILLRSFYAAFPGMSEPAAADSDGAARN